MIQSGMGDWFSFGYNISSYEGNKSGIDRCLEVYDEILESYESGEDEIVYFVSDIFVAKRMD